MDSVIMCKDLQGNIIDLHKDNKYVSNSLGYQERWYSLPCYNPKILDIAENLGRVNLSLHKQATHSYYLSQTNIP